MPQSISKKQKNNYFAYGISSNKTLVSRRFYPTQGAKKLAQFARRIARGFRKTPNKFQFRCKLQDEIPYFKDESRSILKEPLPLPEPTEYERTPSAFHQGDSQPLEVEKPPQAEKEKSRSISIHETPPPKNAQLPIEKPKDYIQEALGHVKLTEAKPRIEEHVYIKSPSVTKVPLKKSRRTKRQRRNKIWYSKEIPTEWKYLAKQTNWGQLSKDEQMRLKIGWPNRHLCLSYEELAKTWGCTKRHAINKIRQWVDEGKLKVEHEFLERRGKLTKIHKRNYYVFTHEGKKEIDKLVNSLGINPKISLRKDPSKEGIFCQDVSRAISYDSKILNTNGEIRFENPEDYHAHLNAALDALSTQGEALKPEIASLFSVFGFESKLPEMAPWLRKEVNKQPVKKIVSWLKWIEKKQKKKWRFKSFWAVFVWIMKNGIPIGWMRKRVEDYLAAINGKLSMEGIDSQAIVAQIIELQKKTGKVFEKRDLQGLLCYHASHLRSYLKMVLFKSNRTPIRNPVGYTHFLAKKPLEEVVKMYKSEKTLQEDRETEGKLLRVTRNHKDVCDWNKLLGDLEHGDREFDRAAAATGTEGDIWD